MNHREDLTVNRIETTYTRETYSIMSRHRQYIDDKHISNYWLPSITMRKNTWKDTEQEPACPHGSVSTSHREAVAAHEDTHTVESPWRDEYYALHP
uniref:Uncharacterized protein n=1 Tax=Heterorhabditis bacteriophora TaxID=37862 RepID=A0A1I7W9P7_HETBA